MRMLQVYGPFAVPFARIRARSSKWIGNEHSKRFWDKVRDSHLHKKQGCYVFCLRAGKGFTPWYVGKAAKSSFQKECFTPHKLNKFNEALSKGKNGTPILFFIALSGKKIKIGAAIIEEVETFLIRAGKDANPSLLNKSKTKPSNWGITGVIRGQQGKPKKVEVAFSKMMAI